LDISFKLDVDPKNKKSFEDFSKLIGSYFDLTEKPPGKLFTYSSDFDKGGILYYLGTNKLTTAYQNPNGLGKVKVTASSIQGATEPDFIDWNSVSRSIQTENTANSWVQIEFVNCQVQPTYYTIRHDYNANYCLRNWRLEGSNDGINWDILKNHFNDGGLVGTALCTASWKIDNIKNFYKFIRIFQYGLNQPGNNHLMCNGFEIYGSLSEEIPEIQRSRKKK